MILSLLRRHPLATTIRTLYGVIVAQARLPEFYRGYGVPDTLEGRFDMIVLHQVLVMRRIAADASLKELGQGIFDLFCRDLDHNLREMGVSDLAVPRKMRGFAGAFYGRTEAYTAALDAGDGAALTEAVARNVFGADVAPPGAVRLAHYMFEAVPHLADIPGAALAAGRLSFVDPAAIPDAKEGRP